MPGQLHEHRAVCLHLEKHHGSQREVTFTTKEHLLFMDVEGRCRGCEHECGPVKVVGAMGSRGAWRIKPLTEPVDGTT